MDDTTALEVMKRFGRAFFKKDPALLGAAKALNQADSKGQ